MTQHDLHVVFGTGPAGLATMDELLARGRRVRMVNRRGLPDAPDGVEVVTGDATDPDFARHASEGAAVVYQAAMPPYNRWPELFPALQDGVLAGAAHAGAKLVVMENLYMYGPSDGVPIREDLPYRATTRKGRTRARLAEQLLQAHRDGVVRVAIGRASDFFGPRVVQSHFGARVFGPALAGKAAQVMGDPDTLHTYTYVEDIGRALVTLGERDEALGRAWHIPAAQTLTTRALIGLVYAEIGRPPKLQAMPRPMVRMVGLFNPYVREIFEMLYEFEEPFLVDHSAYVRAFGDHATPLREAVRRTVAWYRQHAPD